MKLTIVAATGGIGRHLLDQAVSAGHDVTALVRNPDSLPTGIRVVVADLSRAEPEQLAPAIAGADAVLSGLGARSKADTGVARHGTTAIVDAMRASGTRRIVVVSAAPIGTVASPGRPHPPRYDPGEGFFQRHLFSPFAKAAFGDHYVDLARMEDLLRDSGLDWTVLRPPKLTNRALTGRYRTATGRNLPRGMTISRADVAHQMLASLDRQASIGQTIGIAY